MKSHVNKKSLLKIMLLNLGYLNKIKITNNIIIIIVSLIRDDIKNIKILKIKIITTCDFKICN